MKLAPALLLICTACAQAPTKEMELAAIRVASARKAGAGIYAPELLREADEALASARSQIAGGSRNYRPAIRTAAFACIRADEARSYALDGRRKPSADAERLIREVEALLDLTRSRGASSRFPEIMSAMEARLEAQRASLAEGRPETSREMGLLTKAGLLELDRKLR